MKTNSNELIWFFILGALVSCNSSGPKESTVSEDSSVQQSVDTIKPLVEDNESNIVGQAKAYQNTVFMYMSKAINAMNDDAKTLTQKRAAKEEMNNLAKPYQAKIDSLKAFLPANKAKEIDDYRQQLFDQQTNKKKE